MADSFYNANYKLTFMNSLESTETLSSFRTLFKATSDYEYEHGDLCTLSADELASLLENVIGYRDGSKYSVISMVSRYCKWCMAAKIPNAHDYTGNIDVIGFSKVRTSMLANPLHLQKYLDEVYEPVSENTSDNLSRCFLWLAYAGMAEYDIFSVRESDIDRYISTVRYNDAEYPIYREAMDVFKSLMQSKSFNYKNPTYSEGKTYPRYRMPGDTLMRSFISVPSTRTMRNSISSKSKKAVDAGKTDMEITYQHVWLSGLFYRAYERERAGYPPDFKDAALNKRSEFVGDEESGSQQSSLTQSAYAKREQRLKDDYKRWKAAFTV